MKNWCTVVEIVFVLFLDNLYIVNCLDLFLINEKRKACGLNIKCIAGVTSVNMSDFLGCRTFWKHCITFAGKWWNDFFFYFGCCLCGVYHTHKKVVSKSLRVCRWKILPLSQTFSKTQILNMHPWKWYPLWYLCVYLLGEKWFYTWLISCKRISHCMLLIKKFFFR